MNLDDLPRKYQEQATLQLNAGGKAPGPITKSPVRNDILEQATGEKQNTGRYLVRVVSYRRRLLDEDNLCCKFFVDSLRYTSCLPADSPNLCHIETSQVKVRLKSEERTEITVESPGWTG